MKPNSVAGKWVTWLLILFGAAEVPWVILLSFFQPPTVMGYHLRLSAIGLGLGLAATCAVAAWSSWRGTRAAGPFGVAAATVALFLACVLTLSPNLQPDARPNWYVAPLVVAVPAAAAGVVAAVVALRESTSSRIAARVASIVLAVAAAAFLIRGLSHILDPSSTEMMQRTRAIVVLLDTFETIGLLGAGIASLKGRPKATLVLASMAGSLLIVDAWTNVVAAAPGQAFIAALFYLVVGEIPATVLCILAVRSAAGRLAADDVEGHAPEPRRQG